MTPTTPATVPLPPCPGLAAAALRQCGQQCMQAVDGRGRRHPVARCAQALQQLGTPPGLAQQCAQAMGEIAATIRAAAAA